MAKVFYSGRSRSSTPPSPRGDEESGSEAHTDIEAPRLTKAVHKRSESDAATVSALTSEKRVRRLGQAVVKQRTGSRELRDATGRGPLQKAVGRGDYERVQSLLRDPNIDTEDRDYAGTTALHTAALSGEERIVRALLNAGALVDARSGPEELDTPLMDAVANGFESIVRLLLDHGADPRVSNAVGRIGLDFLDESGDPAEALGIKKLLTEATRLLRARGAPIINSPHHPAAKPRLFPPGYSESAPSSGPKFIDISRKSVRAELVNKAAEGDLEVVGLALERGWRPNAEALVRAARHGHNEIVGLLLAFGLSSDAEFAGVTALHEAIARQHVPTVKLLLESGANPTWKKHGKTYGDMVADLPARDELRMMVEAVDPKIKSPEPLEAERHNVAPSEESNQSVTVPVDNVPELPKSAESPSEDLAVSATAQHPDKNNSGSTKDTTTESRTGKQTEYQSTAVITTPEAPVASTEVLRSMQTSPKSMSPKSHQRNEPDKALRAAIQESDALSAEPKPTLSPTSSEGGQQVVVASKVPAQVIKATTSEDQAPQRSVRIEIPEDHRELSKMDLRAIKPKKRSKSTVEAVVPAPQPEISFKQPRAVSESPREMSPALSPLDDEPSRTQWKDRSQELEELAKRKEKERRSRQLKMLESLTNEQRRRSSDLNVDMASDEREGESTPTQLERSVSPAATTPLHEEEPTSVEEPLTSISGLPWVVRNLAYSGGKGQPVLPIFLHSIGDKQYCLDLQISLATGDALLHKRFPRLNKTLVIDQQKSRLWTFCKPWVCKPNASLAEVEADREAFLSLSLCWIPFSQVVDDVYGGSTPSSTHINLDWTPASKARTGFPKLAVSPLTDMLPLKWQFKEARMYKAALW